MTAIRVRILQTAGSVPREAGAEMRVWDGGSAGTIGGGALEWQAMEEARAMLAEGRETLRRTIPLGPALGQCCGGSVTLGFDRVESREMAAPRSLPVWIWGAGHVGRAIAATIAPLPGIGVTWADVAAARFPDPVPAGVETVVAPDLPRLAAHAPQDAHHLILTYSHEIDFALCHALLRRDVTSAGLIGSATKWARFRKRLGQLGHSGAQISRIACPIGDPALGKHPQAIAVGVAAALLKGPGITARGAKTG